MSFLPVKDRECVRSLEMNIVACNNVFSTRKEGLILDLN